MTGTPSRQAVVQGQTDKLFIRSQDPTDYTAIPPTTGHSVSIYSPGGVFLETVNSGFTTSNETLIFSKSWTTGIYPIGDFYRAVFSIVHAGGALIRELYFSVARRKFISQLSSRDLTDRHPYLIDQIPAGFSLDSFVQRAWERILQTLWLKIDQYPGNIFQPENFYQCHEYFALAEFFLSITFDADTRNEDLAKYKIYEKKGIEALEHASSRIDLDSSADGIQRESSKRNLTGIRVVR